MSMHDRRKLFVVGNGPLPENFAATIDAADKVVRFNEAKQPLSASGTKTDLLFLNNTGKPMQRRLNDPGYIVSPIIRSAGTIVFAYHPTTIAQYLIRPNLLSRLKGRRADWTAAALDMFGGAGKDVLILPPTFYEEGCAELGIPAHAMRKVFPSTGYFGIRYVLREFPAQEWDIDICGFSWEGWKRHAWGNERQWVETLAEERRVRVWTIS
ncbi:MAG TPA: hypothetical protein VFJ18_03995 [Pararhizobium sp.]|nr:hypothetical protein [Pararhizobium sp.]